MTWVLRTNWTSGSARALGGVNNNIDSGLVTSLLGEHNRVCHRSRSANAAGLPGQVASGAEPGYAEHGQTNEPMTQQMIGHGDCCWARFGFVHGGPFARRRFA